MSPINKQYRNNAQNGREQFPVIALIVQLLLVCITLAFGTIVEPNSGSYTLFARYGTAIALIDFLLLWGIKGHILSVETLLFASFCLFSFGVPMLSAFDPNYSDFYMSQIDGITLAQFSWYTTMCIEAYSLGLSVVALQHKQKNKYSEGYGQAKKRTHLSDYFAKRADLVVRASTILFIIFGAIAYVYAIRFTAVSLASGIGVARTNVHNNAFDNLARGFFVPLGFMILAYESRPSRKNLVVFVLVLYGFISCVSGDRTEGLTLLVALFTYWYRRMNSKNRVAFSKKGLSILLAAILAFSIPAIAVLRVGGSVNGLNFVSSVEDIFGELGFNFYTVCFQSYLFHDLYLGKTYIYSLAALIPGSLDFFGIIDACSPLMGEALFNSAMQSSYPWATFGLGYSLVAESFLNFGPLGVVAILILGWAVGNLCDSRKTDLYSDYLRYSFLWSGLTLARRSFNFFVNSIEYIGIFIPISIYIIVKIEEYSKQSNTFIIKVTQTRGSKSYE